MQTSIPDNVECTLRVVERRQLVFGLEIAADVLVQEFEHQRQTIGQHLVDIGARHSID
jgi:hypothetical protein